MKFFSEEKKSTEIYLNDDNDMRDSFADDVTPD